MPFASSNAATGATAAPASRRSLRAKIASGLVLGLVALACVYAGGWPWVVLVAIVSVILAAEWAGMCAGRPALQPDGAGWVSIAAVGCAILLGGGLGARVGLAFLLAGAVATGLAALASSAADRWWRPLGVLYVGVPCLAIVWLRASPQAGLAVVAWLLVLVWAVDTAAYATGKQLAGPKLAPAISPSKTWSGLAGGVVAAMLVGAATALWGRTGSLWTLVGVSAALAVVEQAGDLLESAAKRRFGVKDSSAIIPGHGGFLDRVDGLMAVAVAVAGMTLAGAGDILKG